MRGQTTSGLNFELISIPKLHLPKNFSIQVDGLPVINYLI